MDELGFQHFALEDPFAAAVVDPGGAVWSRGRLAALVNRTARALHAHGLRPGDALAIAAPNCAEYLATVLGGLAAGLQVVPINWHLSEAELGFLLKDSAARALVVHEGLGPLRLAVLLEHARDARFLASIGAVPGCARLETLAAPYSAEPPHTGRRGRVMAYTSATTGRPKAVRLPIDSAQTALRKVIRWHISLGIEPEADNVHLSASMLYHGGPLDGALIALEMGHRVVLMDRWTPETLLAQIERRRVTTAFMVPTMFVRLLKLPRSARRRRSVASLRFVVHGGAPCPVEIKRRMIEWWGPIIWEAYASSEVQGTIVSAEDWLRWPGTVGKPIPGSAVSILDEAGRELPPNRVGLVYLRPHTGERFEYKGDPHATAACYRGELVTAGDLGYLNEHGFLFLCGRRSDLILMSGMNVYPSEIEHVLVQHPAVEDCAVVGVAHELLGEVPKAFVKPAVPGDGDGRLTGELLGFLSQRLSPMKLPRRIEYVASLPRGPNGKLYRRRLRETAESPAAAEARA